MTSSDAPAPDRQVLDRLTALEELTEDLAHLVNALTHDLAGRRPATVRGIAADADPYAPIAASRR